MTGIRVVHCCSSCIHIGGYAEDPWCRKHKKDIYLYWICDDFERGKTLKYSLQTVPANPPEIS